MQACARKTCSAAAGLLIFACNPIFKIADDYLPTPVVLFATFGGLRGTVSLILAQMLVTQQDQTQKSKDMEQTAQVRLLTPHTSAAGLNFTVKSGVGSQL